MRLDDFDPNDVNIEDQRGSGGGFGFGGGGGQGLRIGGGGLGLGTIIVLMIGAWLLGINPLSVLGLAGGGQSLSGPAEQSAAPRAGTDAASSCRIDAASLESCKALSSLNKTWRALFQARGHEFSTPHLVFYSQNGRSGCGAAQSAMGPFYCPADNGIYLDTDFYTEMDRQLGATGQFARDYVIAHEYGHHIQNLLGTSRKVQAAQEADSAQANPLSVRLELQADCYAGVWAARNRDRLEPGDMQSGLNAAHQIGDDVLQKAAGRTPVESSFTHGSAAQRMAWLKKGLDSGDPSQCNTFAGAI